MIQIFIAILLILHFAYHIISSIGIVWSLLHSYNAHKKQVWKLVMAIVWLILSVLLLVVSEDTLHHHTC